MSRNPELDRLKAEQQSLFEQKQAAFQRFKDLQEQTNAAHDVMQSAWMIMLLNLQSVDLMMYFAFIFLFYYATSLISKKVKRI